MHLNDSGYYWCHRLQPGSRVGCCWWSFLSCHWVQYRHQDISRWRNCSCHISFGEECIDCEIHCSSEPLHNQMPLIKHNINNITHHVAPPVLWSINLCWVGLICAVPCWPPAWTGLLLDQVHHLLFLPMCAWCASAQLLNQPVSYRLLEHYEGSSQHMAQLSKAQPQWAASYLPLTPCLLIRSSAISHTDVDWLTLRIMIIGPAQQQTHHLCCKPSFPTSPWHSWWPRSACHSSALQLLPGCAMLLLNCVWSLWVRHGVNPSCR